MLEDILQQKILAYQALNKRKFADILKIVIVIRAKSIFNKFMKTMKALKNDSWKFGISLESSLEDRHFVI